MITRFAAIKRFGERSGRCESCGKLARRRQTFWQTINPWNLDAQGKTKSMDQIGRELEEERAEWERLPLLHKKCEP